VIEYFRRTWGERLVGEDPLTTERVRGRAVRELKGKNVGSARPSCSHEGITRSGIMKEGEKSVILNFFYENKKNGGEYEKAP